MSKIILCIEQLRLKLKKYRNNNLKEYPTRTIFIDPMLRALGWDVEDPDEVQLEYPTIDGKSVDYAPIVNRKPVLFIEAKSLNDPLTDVKAITQVVGYAANAGVEWCILTNGITYKVYRSTEKAKAPDKLMFEVSIDPKESEDRSIQQIAEQLNRFSRDSMEKGVLDKIGEEVFTTGKIRKALDKLFMNPPRNLIRIIRKSLADDTIKPRQIEAALKRLWAQSPGEEISPIVDEKEYVIKTGKKGKRGKDYLEEYHTKGKPREVLELYRAIDKYCREMVPGKIERKFLAKYVRYNYQKHIFCCVRLRKIGLRIRLKLDFSSLKNPPEFMRDVSRIGHSGVGEVEMRIDDLEQLQKATSYIRKSFEQNIR